MIAPSLTSATELANLVSNNESLKWNKRIMVAHYQIKDTGIKKSVSHSQHIAIC